MGVCLYIAKTSSQVGKIMSCFSSSWDGTLSQNDFSVAAHVFTERWERNNSSSPSWFWVNSPKGPPFLASSQHVAVLSFLSISF
jgi:ubiquitin-like-conjugating enzyme ATG10